MELQHFLRLITISIFQPEVTNYKKMSNGLPMCYEFQSFKCPRIICKDKFEISIQISSENFCSNENGYQTFGFVWKEVEFGFPNRNEVELFPFSKGYNNQSNFDVTKEIGRIPVDKIESILLKHGGIDFNETLSVKKCIEFVESNYKSIKIYKYQFNAKIIRWSYYTDGILQVVECPFNKQIQHFLFLSEGECVTINENLI